MKMAKVKTIEELNDSVALKELELMVTEEEFKAYTMYCIQHDIKFNEWIRQLAQDALEK